MEAANISSVTVHIGKDGMDMQQVSVTAFGQTKQTDENGKATFNDVTGGKQTIVVKDSSKIYSVPVYVLSSDLDINLTHVQAAIQVPGARQEAYKKASDSMPLFVGMMVVFGVLLIGILYLFNKKFSFLPGFVRWFLQMVIVVIVLLAGIFITAYANGSQDKLFAMLSVEQSARASTDTIPAPVNVNAVGGKNSINLSWEGVEDPTFTRAYLIRWGKNAEEVVKKTRLTNGTTTRFDKLEAKTEYSVEIQTLDISDGSPRLSDPVRVTAKTQ
jgi:hypothetical protein